MELEQEITQSVSMAKDSVRPPGIASSSKAFDAVDPGGQLLAACLDSLVRFLLTGCRLHAQRTALLLERVEVEEVGDSELQALCLQASALLRAIDRSGNQAVCGRRALDHV